MKPWLPLLFACVGFSFHSHFLHSQSLPTYSIQTVRGANAFEGGGADSNNVVCKLNGVVYGRNIGATGNRVQFTLRDASGGIGLFKNVNDLPIQLNEGDSIRAVGLINSFNGLAQITVDSVRRLATNRPLRLPRLVNQLDESTESDLVRLEGWQLSNPASWPSLPGGSGFTVKIKKGSSEIDLRIDNDCDLFGAPAPMGYLNIVGIGGQFDSSIPRNSGYQLLPRSMADITPGLPPVKPAIRFLQNDTLLAENAGLVLIPVQISPTPESQTVAVFVAQDSNAVNGQDYSLPPSAQITFPANFSGLQFISIQVLDNSQDQPNRTFFLRLRPLAGDTTYTIGADSVLRFQILDNDLPLRQYPIGQVRGNNSLLGGVADSLGVRCILRGVVTSPNFRKSESELELAFRDGSGAIHLYYNDVWPEIFRVGDSIRVVGTLQHQFGRSFIFPDSIVKIADSLASPPAFPVDTLQEGSESELVRLQGYSILNPENWNPAAPDGFSLRVSNGLMSFSLWMDNDAALPAGSSVPTGLLNITGIGDQADSLEPYTSGYRLKPRGMFDFSPANSVNQTKFKADIDIFPNPYPHRLSVVLPEALLSEKLWFQLLGLDGKRLYGAWVAGGDLQAEINACLEKVPVKACWLQISTSRAGQFSKLLIRE